MKVKGRAKTIDVRQTLADRLVSYLNPVRGLERLRARGVITALEGGYDGGKRDKRNLRRWRLKEQSADSDTLPDLPDLRSRSRDLRRNVPLATGAIATTTTNVVGEGLQLKASVDRAFLKLSDEAGDALEAQLEREWRHFSKTCDFTNVQDGSELQELVFSSALESGDVFIVRRFRKDPGDVFGTKLQIIEADRVSNPNRAADTDTIINGVEVDPKTGVPVAYHVSDRHPFSTGGRAQLKWERVPARTPQGKQTVIHLYSRFRPELTRGVPYLSPVIEELKVLGDYSDAEVTAALVSAMFTVFVKSSGDQTGGPIIGTATDEAGAPVGGINEVKLGHGAIIGLAQGEDITTANPGRPNANFDPFFISICRQIGVALELPFELLIKHFTASYSASRAALEMAWQFFRKRRGWLARCYCQIVYEWFVEEAVASGRINAPGFFTDPLVRDAYCRARWIGPGRPSIDQVKDAEADEKNLAMRVTNREEIRVERFGDRGTWSACNQQLMKEESQIPATAAAAPASSSSPAGARSDGGNDDDTETADTQQRGKA